MRRVAAGRRIFREFLRCEYSEENILFWLACEELKKESNPDLIEEKARFIYEDYISILSPKEVRKTMAYFMTAKKTIHMTNCFRTQRNVFLFLYCSCTHVKNIVLIFSKLYLGQGTDQRCAF